MQLRPVMSEVIGSDYAVRLGLRDEYVQLTRVEARRARGKEYMGVSVL